MNKDKNKLLNLTPHEIKIITTGYNVTFAPFVDKKDKQWVARCTQSKQVMNMEESQLWDFPVYSRARYTGVEDIPSISEVDGIIVASLVAKYLISHLDFWECGSKFDASGQLKAEIMENTQESLVNGLDQVAFDRIISGQLKVFSPDTGPESSVRNEQGQIIGVRRLVYWPIENKK